MGTAQSGAERARDRRTASVRGITSSRSPRSSRNSAVTEKRRGGPRDHDGGSDEPAPRSDAVLELDALQANADGCPRYQEMLQPSSGRGMSYAEACPLAAADAYGWSWLEAAAGVSPADRGRRLREFVAVLQAHGASDAARVRPRHATGTGWLLRGPWKSAPSPRSSTTSIFYRENGGSPEARQKDRAEGHEPRRRSDGPSRRHPRTGLAFRMAGTRFRLSELRGRPVTGLIPGGRSPVGGDESRSSMRFCRSSSATTPSSSASPSTVCGSPRLCGGAPLRFPLLATSGPGRRLTAYGAYREGTVLGTCAVLIDPRGMIHWSYISPSDVNPGADGSSPLGVSAERAAARPTDEHHG